MRPPVRAGSRPAAGGFTLAEVAVTLVIVATGLLFVLEGINAAKLNAAQSRNVKLARELGLLTLGQIESGLYGEDIRNDRLGPYSYAEEGYPEFEFEAVFGGETFLERDEYGRFDNWHYEEEEEDEEDEDAEQPYEEVEIKVVFPPISGRKNEVVLKRYVPWRQVYGAPEDEEAELAEAPGE